MSYSFDRFTQIKQTIIKVATFKYKLKFTFYKQVGNTFGHQFFMLDVCRGQMERRFSMPDDTTMTTISTDWHKYVVAGTWEAAIYVWSVGTEPTRPAMIYQSQNPTTRAQSSNSQVRVKQILKELIKVILFSMR